MPGPPDVEFYYCCTCPSSYLALVRLREAALRTEAKLVLRPIVKRWLADEHGAPGVAARGHRAEAEAAYAAKDVADWARFCGVRIDASGSEAVDGEWAQRGAVAAIDAGRIAEYAEAIFKAQFTEGRDVADRAVIVEAASRCGMPRPSFEAALQSGHTESILRRNTAELLKRGGFRTPTMFVGDDMYVGHERVPLLEWALMRSAERPFIAPGEHGR
jgi:2-hydroxychromene-2-carboxylate isomerase